MMSKLFMVYGAAITGLFVYASYVGWDVINFDGVSKGPSGIARAGYHGSRMYHK